MFTPSGSALASAACCSVIMCSLAIASSTSLRRPLAASGERTGEYCDGACGRPASSADSASVSFVGDLLK
jgi:hypothetical protein